MKDRATPVHFSPVHFPSPDLLEQYQVIIWEISEVLYHVDVKWEAMRSTITALYPRLKGPSLGIVLNQARSYGVHQSVFDLIAQQERAELEKQSGFIDQNISLLRQFRERSLIVTNCMSDTVLYFFELIGAEPVPFCSADLALRLKPDAEPINHLLPYWEGKRTLMICASAEDETAARAAGVEPYSIK